MKASVLLKRLGKNLVGKRINTKPMGWYPGGIATITEIKPDREAPEIAFNVFNETWDDNLGGHEIGVLNYEDVELVDE